MIIDEFEKVSYYSRYQIKVLQSKLYHGRPTKRVQDSEDYKYISNKWRRFQYSNEGKKEDNEEERRQETRQETRQEWIVDVLS